MKRSDWVRWGSMGLLSLVVARFALAHNEIPDPPASSTSSAMFSDTRTVLVRGKPSTVANINIGPKATAYWNLIQGFLKTGDLDNFGDIARVLHLSIKEPIDAVDLAKPGNQIRKDLSTADGSIESGTYLIYRGIPGRTAISIKLKLDLSEVCIPEMEVRRVYGKGFYAPVADKTYEPGEREDPTGTSHGLSILDSVGKVDFGFLIAASGCVQEFSASQEHFAR